MYRVQTIIDFGDGRHPNEVLPARFFMSGSEAKQFSEEIRSRWGGAHVFISKVSDDNRPNQWDPKYDWVLAKERIE